jgi:DNA repair protein RadC
MNYNLKDYDLYTSDKEYVLKVRDLADEDKPREKLIKHGPEILSVAELLAILLNVGTKKEGVLQMTSRVLKEYGEKNIINQKNPKDLERDLDIPLTKACQIIACFELGRRLFKETKGGITIVRTPKQAFEYLKDMRDLPKEHLRGIYLNSRYQVIHDEVISIGSLTASVIHPREVFRPAIEYSAAALILAHNHPSGSIKPTQPDIEITNHLKKVGEMLGIDLLDHIIIAKNKFYSIMSDNKKKIK